MFLLAAQLAKTDRYSVANIMEGNFLKLNICNVLLKLYHISYIFIIHKHFLVFYIKLSHFNLVYFYKKMTAIGANRFCEINAFRCCTIVHFNSKRN